MKLDYVLNTQEVIERKVKELHEIIQQATKSGIEVNVTEGANGQILVDVKVNPKLLEIK